MASTVNTATAISLTETCVLATVNAGGVSFYGQISEVEKYSVAEITAHVLNADAQVCQLLLRSGREGRRVPFLTTALIGSPALMPSSAGEIDSVQINNLIAVRADPLTIERNNANVLALPQGTYLPKFTTVGQTVFHNAAHYGLTSALITYADFTLTSACQAPSEYTLAVVALATAMAISKGGDKADSQAGWLKIGEMFIPFLARGESLPPLPTTQEAQVLQAAAASMGMGGGQ